MSSRYILGLLSSFVNNNQRIMNVIFFFLRINFKQSEKMFLVQLIPTHDLLWYKYYTNILTYETEMQKKYLFFVRKIILLSSLST